MTTEQIIEALTAAQLAVVHGQPLSTADRVLAVKALGVVRFLPGPERVAIHEAVLKSAKLCAAA